jgi:tRNA 2-thiouridine synthesizing protein A
MSEIVDARGLSCPQPVLLVMSKIQEKASGEIEVIVDNEGSRENVGRAALARGWEVREERQEGDDWHLILAC